LRHQGARVQRPLWASTGTKNPKYSDVMYIESLIGPDTVNTIPPATYDAFKDHGRVIMTLDQNVDEAKRVLDEFEAKGHSLKAITDKLTADGVKSFDESFAQLMSTIEARRDATVPEAVQLLEEKIDVARTLFMVASKSGSTTEPIMFHRYFYDRVKRVKGDRAGQNFIAVTDPGKQLAKDAERDGFRKVFLNMPDIGGRYSALSYFGLVPAAIAGVDIATLVDRAVHAAHVAVTPSIRKNPAALLGCAIGGSALQGRDKLTLITPRPLDTLGLS